MGAVHQLIEAKGKHAAIATGLDRDVIEAAAKYMGDEDSGLGFIYSGWAQCALPIDGSQMINHGKLLQNESA